MQELLDTPAAPSTDVTAFGALADREREPTPAERLSGYFRRIARRKRLVVLITLLTTVVATGMAVSNPKQYEASATLYFPQTPPLAQALSTPVAQPADTEREANTNVALVTSPTVAAAVISQLGLKTSIADLLPQVQAAVSSNSDLVSVTATTGGAQGAARLANAFATQYVAFRRYEEQAALSQAISQATHALESIPTGKLGAQQRRVLAARIQELKAARAVQTGPAQVVQLATPPTSPSSPHPKQAAVMGFGLGLILAIGLVLAIDLLDRRLKDEDEIAAALQVPVLGALPSDARKKRGTHLPALDDDQRRATALLALCLRLQGRGDAPILVSAIGRDDSHARVTLGLAAALAKVGRRVLVIQVGAQGSGLDKLLGLVDRPGLGVALECPEALAENLVCVGATSLGVVGGGERSGATFDLLPIGYAGASYDELGSPAMQRLLASASWMADVVLVSIASIQDALAFVDESFTLLLVARLNSSTRDAAERAVLVLRNAQITAHGVVVTDADRSGILASA